MEPKIISSIDDIDGLQFGDAFVIDNPDLADPIEFSDWLAENEKPLIDAVERHLFGQADGELVGTPITVADFRGTGFGAATIAKAAKQGITTVEQLAELGEKGINELSGISDSEAAKIWARVGELLA